MPTSSVVPTKQTSFTHLTRWTSELNGRVYLIIVTATDTSGNVSRSYHTVVVPKSNKQANIDSVNAEAAAAVSYAQTHNGAPPPGYFVIGDGPIIGPKQ